MFIKKNIFINVFFLKSLENYIEFKLTPLNFNKLKKTKLGFVCKLFTYKSFKNKKIFIDNLIWKRFNSLKSYRYEHGLPIRGQSTRNNKKTADKLHTQLKVIKQQESKNMIEKILKSGIIKKILKKKTKKKKNQKKKKNLF